jgi:hypothetical protein
MNGCQLFMITKSQRGASTISPPDAGSRSAQLQSNEQPPRRRSPNDLEGAVAITAFLFAVDACVATNITQLRAGVNRRDLNYLHITELSYKADNCEA